MMFKNSMGSYEQINEKMYQPPPAGTPGWELAPVPGWGTNPLRSGPPVLATNGIVPARSTVDWTPVSGCSSCGGGVGAADSEEQANQGYIALAAAGGIFFGWFLAWAYFYNNSQKKRA